MTPLRLNAADGYELALTHFTPSSPARGVVVMAGATGVAQRFYRRFAEALTEHALEVVTIDYRGIGESRPRSLRGFDCHYPDWATRDLPVAVNFATSRGPTVVVGHSFGGHAFGQLPDPNVTLGLYTVATGAAWSGYMPLGERIKVETMWNIIGPPVTTWCGYLPGRAWGGEDMPLGIYADWKRWSAMPHYFFDDAKVAMQAMFDRVRVPVRGVTASDDVWAPPRSMKAFLSHYRNAPLTLETQTPAELGVKTIGHMGHFKKHVLPTFVPRVVGFVNERLSSPTSSVAHPASQSMQSRS